MNSIILEHSLQEGGLCKRMKVFMNAVLIKKKVVMNV